MSRFIERLVDTARTSPRGIVVGEPRAPMRYPWSQVHARARTIAGALVDQHSDVGEHGDGIGAVAILAGEPELIAPAAQAVWLAGGSVTMLHQPTPRTDLEMWADDTIHVLDMIGAKLVLLGKPFDALAPVLEQHGIAYRTIDGLLSTAEPIGEPVARQEDDPALLQLTSGSTAEPKAVRITHGNLFANMTSMALAAKLDASSDTMVSWLPLFHDMGMVGFLTVPMTLGIELVKVTPVEFLSAPLCWPELITKYHGTITAAPNFAWAMIGRRLAKADDGAYDLSRLRIALNGAEPIDVAAVRAFVDAGERFGMRPGCVLPAYGMAEATLAVAFNPLDRGLVVDHVDAHALEHDKRANPLRANESSRVNESSESADARSFALLGPPLPGLEVDVIDDAGRRLGDREVGQLRIRGEAVTPGYLTVDGPVSTLDSDGWLRTGDLGYLVDGEVVVCGRIKDVIIMGGRNIYPTDIERAACSVDGVRAGNAVAVRIDAGTKRERFAVVLESSIAGDEPAETLLRKEVTGAVVDAVGVRPFAVLVLGKGKLPKTPSGKLRRAAAADLVS
ncbi:MAG: fatty acyl-AMP ligase [Sciscionella sp.]|nr:fatty acyl-AMP ligase [Sciscionella sp.]